MENFQNLVCILMPWLLKWIKITPSKWIKNSEFHNNYSACLKLDIGKLLGVEKSNVGSDFWKYLNLGSMSNLKFENIKVEITLEM